MDRAFQGERYTSQKVKDRKEGYEGYELLRHAYGETSRVVRIVYWDAAPGFFFEVLDDGSLVGSSVPLEIVEEFIAEVKAVMMG